MNDDQPTPYQSRLRTIAWSERLSEHQESALREAADELEALAESVATMRDNGYENRNRP